MTLRGPTPELPEAEDAFNDNPADRKCLIIYLAALQRAWQDSSLDDPDYIAGINNIIDRLDEIEPVFVALPSDEDEAEEECQ